MTSMTTKKPYLLEDCKSTPHDKISEAEFERWKGVMLANIKKNNSFVPYLAITWGKSTISNRGLEDDETATARDKTLVIDSLLAHVSHYGPAVLQRDITKRCTSLENVWQCIRTWAGLKTSGHNLLAYYRARTSYDPDLISPTDFYYKLFNLKEDTLLLRDSSIRYEGEIVTQDEEMSSGDKNLVLLDWLHALGGDALVEHVFRVYCKDLECETLHDIRQRIIDSIETLKIEAENYSEIRSARARQALTAATRFSRPQTQRQDQRARVRAPSGGGPFTPTQGRGRGRGKTPSFRRAGPPCLLCAAQNLPQAQSHSIASCFQIPASERALLVRSAEAEGHPDEIFDDDEDNGYVDAIDEESYDENVDVRAVMSSNKAFQSYPLSYSRSSNKILPPGHIGPIKVNKINIYDSPILTVKLPTSSM